MKYSKPSDTEENCIVEAKPKRRRRSQRRKASPKRKEEAIIGKFDLLSEYDSDNQNFEKNGIQTREEKWLKTLSTKISLINFTSILERAEQMVVQTYFDRILT